MSTATQERVPVGTWTADKIHSTVAFEVNHLGISTFRGGFDDYEARLVSGDDGVRLEGSAKVASVSVPDENLKGHLQSHEFFDAERHPKIKFSSEALKVDGDGQVSAKGELEIAGHKQAIIASGQIGEQGVGPDGSERIPVELEATVDRTEYGMDWNSELPNGKQALADAVKLVVTLELVREEA